MTSADARRTQDASVYAETPNTRFERGIRTAASHETTIVSISANEETDDAGVIVGERSFFSSGRPSPPSTLSAKGWARTGRGRGVRHSFFLESKKTKKKFFSPLPCRPATSVTKALAVP